MSDRAPSGSALAVDATRARWIGSAIVLWIACSSVYFLTAPGRIDIIDGAIRYEVTESLLDAGRPLVRNQDLPAVIGREGQEYSYYLLGTPLTALPFLAVGRTLGSNALEAKQFAFSLTTVPFAAGTAAVFFLVLGRLGCTRRQSLLWSLVLSFCTPLWPYAGSSFDTALQTFWLTLAVWAAVEAFASGLLRWAALAGIAFALLINVQETYIVLVVCLAHFLTGAHALAFRKRFRTMLVVAVFVVLGLGAIFGYNAYAFGSPLTFGRVTVPHPLMGNTLIGLAGLLVSPAKSIFLYSPTYAFALIGLQRLIRKDQARFGVIAACLAIHVALTASLRFWAGEWAWGPRYLVVSLPLVCLGLPFAARNAVAKRVLTGCAALGFAVQLLAISVDHQRYYFERSLRPFFWLDESWMYRDSPLFARPTELIAIARHQDVDRVEAMVPGPRPFSMTSSIFGRQSYDEVPGRDWMKHYLVFLVPRPWPLWAVHLKPEQRPGPVATMVALATAIALASGTALYYLAWKSPATIRPPAAQTQTDD